MLLTLDIGNTTISYGLFQGVRLFEKGHFSTQRRDYPGPFRHLEEIDALIVSSVVPASLRKFKSDWLKKSSKQPLILGENIKVPIVNLYKRPSQVGADRLVNAYAGYQLYGGGLIIVDFGTAVTFDVVSYKGEYLGGMIFPGINISLQALCSKAALLPKRIKLRPSVNIIGRDTEESICSGIYNGFLCLSRGVIRLIRKQYGSQLKVVFTGGDAKRMQKFLSRMGIFDSDLTLKGLSFVYNNRLNRAIYKEKM